MTNTQGRCSRNITDYLIKTLGLTPERVQQFGSVSRFNGGTQIQEIVRTLHPVVKNILIKGTASCTSADTARMLHELYVDVSNDYALMLWDHAAEAAIALSLEERIEALDLECETPKIDRSVLWHDGDRVTREWQPWMREMANELINEFGLNQGNTGSEPDPEARFRSRYKPLSPEATEAIKLQAMGLGSERFEQLGWLTLSYNTAAFQDALVALGIDLSQCNPRELYYAAASAALFLCVMRYIPR